MIRRLTICLLAVALLAASASAEAGLEEMWRGAMEDAVFADDDEVLPLVCLTRDDPGVIWDGEGERVLLVTWHANPDGCPVGRAIAEDFGEVWATSLGEMQAWFANAAPVEDWTLRFAQLLGLHADEGCTHFSAFWVSPEDVVRPAYERAVNAQMHNDYTRVASGDFKVWFDANILYSYFDTDYPWTRLGYTYDWSGESEYGLTEFLLSDNGKAEVALTMSTEEFVAWLEKGGFDGAQR